MESNAPIIIAENTTHLFRVEKLLGNFFIFFSLVNGASFYALYVLPVNDVYVEPLGETQLDCQTSPAFMGRHILLLFKIIHN
jgi:hypothetical protein